MGSKTRVRVLTFRQAYKIVQKMLNGSHFALIFEAEQFSTDSKICCKCVIYSAKRFPFRADPHKNWHEAIEELRKHLNKDDGTGPGPIDPLEIAPE